MNISVEQLTSLRDKMIYHQMMGEYKNYVQARKDYAKLYMQFPEKGLQMPRTQERISVFSKVGRNIIKVWFRDLFRKKTPDEIRLMQFAESVKAKELSGWNG